jgi:hypothetical protein
VEITSQEGTDVKTSTHEIEIETEIARETRRESGIGTEIGTERRVENVKETATEIEKRTSIEEIIGKEKTSDIVINRIDELDIISSITLLFLSLFYKYIL